MKRRASSIHIKLDIPDENEILSPKLVRQFTKQLSTKQLSIKEISKFESMGIIDENECNIIKKNVTRILNTYNEHSIWTCINTDTVKLLTKNLPIIVEVYKQRSSTSLYTGIGSITSTKINLNTSNLFFSTKSRIKSIVSPNKVKKTTSLPISKFNISAHTFYKVNLKGIHNVNMKKCNMLPFEFCNNNNFNKSAMINTKTNKHVLNLNPVQEINTGMGSFIICSIYDSEFNKVPDHFAMGYIKCQQPNTSIRSSKGSI